MAEGCSLELPQILAPGVFIENIQLQKEITPSVFETDQLAGLYQVYGNAESSVYFRILSYCSLVVFLCDGYYREKVQINEPNQVP